MVAAADDGVATVGERAIEDGALHAGDTGDPPGGTPVQPEDRPNQAQAGAVGMFGERMTGVKCHNSRTDPYAMNGGLNGFRRTSPGRC
jgi:hypothetical protein